MSDLFTLENSMLSQAEESVYTNKQWRWFQDTNNGVYNNQVSFDLSGLYNAQSFTNPKEMYVQLPMVAVISQNAAAGIPVGGLKDCFCLKNGYHNLIDSIIVSYDGGTQIQQACNNQNFYTSFDKLTKLSEQDLQTLGPTIGFYPDSPFSWDYKNAAGGNAEGYGLTNNRNYWGSITTNPVAGVNAGVQVPAIPATTYYVSDKDVNLGFKERNSYISQDLSAKNIAFKTENNMQTEFYPYTKLVRAGANTDYQVWYFVATIRLRDVCSFFDKAPLIKGFYSRITLNLNTGSTVLTRAGAANGAFTAVQNNFRYNTCPFMVSSTLSSKLDNATTQVVVGLHLSSVVSTPGATVNQSTLNIIKHPMPTCRLYAPIITLETDTAIRYLSNKIRYIEFEELSNVVYPNVGADQTFSINISNSVIDPTGILVVPILSASQKNAGGADSFGFSASQSPFTSEPATTSPLISLYNFNIQLAGQNVFGENIVYNWEMFYNELYQHNKINGGLTDGFSSGLLGYKEFLNNYRYYYVDLSRRNSESKSPKSIVVVGKNGSPVIIDLYIFVIKKKSIELNVETGRIKTKDDE